MNEKLSEVPDKFKDKAIIEFSAGVAHGDIEQSFCIFYREILSKDESIEKINQEIDLVEEQINLLTHHIEQLETKRDMIKE